MHGHGAQAEPSGGGTVGPLRGYRAIQPFRLVQRESHVRRADEICARKRAAIFSYFPAAHTDATSISLRRAGFFLFPQQWRTRTWSRFSSLFWRFAGEEKKADVRGSRFSASGIFEKFRAAPGMARDRISPLDLAEPGISLSPSPPLSPSLCLSLSPFAQD